MTAQQQRTELENAGWFVGNRDRSVGEDEPGIFMVSREEDWFVGDDLAELIAEVYGRSWALIR